MSPSSSSSSSSTSLSPAKESDPSSMWGWKSNIGSSTTCLFSIQREDGFKCLILFPSLFLPPHLIGLSFPFAFWYILFPFLQICNLFYSWNVSHSFLVMVDILLAHLVEFMLAGDIFESGVTTGRSLLQAKKGNTWFLMPPPSSCFICRKS